MSERIKSTISCKEGMKAKQILGFGILPDGISVQINSQVFGNMSQEDKARFEKLQGEMVDFITHRLESLFKAECHCKRCDDEEECQDCDMSHDPFKDALIDLVEQLKEVLTK